MFDAKFMPKKKSDEDLLAEEYGLKNGETERRAASENPVPSGQRKRSAERNAGGGVTGPAPVNLSVNLSTPEATAEEVMVLLFGDNSSRSDFFLARMTSVGRCKEMF